MADGSHGDHYLSASVIVRLTPNELEWIDTVRRGLNPPVSRSYMVRSTLVAFRHLYETPLKDLLKPLPSEAQAEIRGGRAAEVVAIRESDAQSPSSDQGRPSRRRRAV